MRKLHGAIIPVVTPFSRDGEILFDGIRANLEKWNRTGVGGYMFLGTNGEFRSLSDEESVRVTEASLDAAAGDKAHIVGIGRESLHQTLAVLRLMRPLWEDIDYFSVLTPCYFKKQMTDDALYAYYTAIADASPVPLLLYTAPSYANQVTISPELLRCLADHPNIAGIKDTSADMMDSYMDAAGGRGDFAVIAGSVKNLQACLARGGESGILSAANYLPEACAEIIRCFDEGDVPRFEAKAAALRALTAATAAPYGVSGVKACMNLLGYTGGWPRLPVLPLAEDVRGKLADVFREAGYPVGD